MIIVDIQRQGLESLFKKKKQTSIQPQNFCAEGQDQLSKAVHRVGASLRKHSLEHILVAGTDLWVGNTAENNTEGAWFPGTPCPKSEWQP